MPSVPYTFSPGTVISSSQVNANFAALANTLSASGGQVSGSILPDAGGTLDLGSATNYWRAVYTMSLRLMDTDHSNYMSVVLGSNLTANRTFTLITGDSDRSLTLTGNSSIGGTAYVAGGTDVALADGGTGQSLADPGADRILFFDESGGGLTWLTVGSGLTITGTSLTSAGVVGGSTGATDNRLVRSDGTGGTTVQSTGITVDDSNNTSGVADLQIGTSSSFVQAVKLTNGTTYLAASDGWISASVDCTGGGGSSGSLTVFSDSSNPPTTVVGGTFSIDGFATSVLFPVKKNNRYKIVSTVQGGTPVFAALWTSLGING